MSNKDVEQARRNLKNLMNSSNNLSNVKINNLLSTEVWVPLKGLNEEPFLISQELKLSIPNGFRIFDAIMSLKAANIRAVKVHSPNYGKIFLVDENQAKSQGLLELANFINQKTYVLNPRLNNSFVWEELKLNKQQPLKLETFSLTGGSNEKIVNGEFAAIKNIIMMSGGNNYLPIARHLEKLDNGIKSNLTRGNISLSSEDKERISVLFKKVLKYSERLSMIEAYTRAYNELPEDKKQGDDLKRMVDLHETSEKKYERASTNLFNFINSVEDEDEKEYYTVKPKTLMLHEFNYDHIKKNQIALVVFKKLEAKIVKTKEELNNEIYNLKVEIINNLDEIYSLEGDLKDEKDKNNELETKLSKSQKGRVFLEAAQAANRKKIKFLKESNDELRRAKPDVKKMLEGVRETRKRVPRKS